MEGFHQSSMGSASEDLVQDCNRSSRSASDYSDVALDALVASIAEYDDRPPSPPTADSRSDDFPTGSGPTGSAGSFAAPERFNRVAYQRQRFVDEGFPSHIASFYAEARKIKSEEATMSRFEKVLQTACEFGIDLFQKPRTALAIFAYERWNRARNSSKLHDRFSETTLKKYASAVSTVIGTCPESGRPLHESLKEIIQLAGKQLPKPVNVMMNHTFDPEWVWKYLDTLGGDHIISNEQASDFHIQLRFIVAMFAAGNRRGADLAHILWHGCSVNDTKQEFTLTFEYLKKWGDGLHSITYEINPIEFGHRDPADHLRELLRRRRQTVHPELDVTCPYLLLCRDPMSNRLTPKNPTPNTIYSWVKKEVLTCAGFEEFSGYDLLKTFVTNDAKLEAKGVHGMITRWKSPAIKYRHYVKKDAQVWLPRHLREDPEELSSEYDLIDLSSHSLQFFGKTHRPTSHPIN